MQDDIPMNVSTTAKAAKAETTRFKVLGAISFSHFLNDMIQSLIIAIYPLLKGTFALSFVQIGLITFTYQLCASILQPLIGAYTDRHPHAHSLSFGMSLTLVGLLTLAYAPSYEWVLAAAALIGCGSAIFHPESSRIARLASGGRHGLAQSIFQVGGNTGSATGPLLAALIIMPRGRSSIAWFGIAALIAVSILWNVGAWYQRQHLSGPRPAIRRADPASPVPRGTVIRSLAILMLLLFSKYFYLASITSYYAFYLMAKFHLAMARAQLYLFVFLFAVALGTMLGGPIGDRIGRKRVIWASILGIAPFTLVLPYVGLEWTMALSFLVGLILSSAFSAILVYAQELLPGKVGTVSGLFFGLAFGIGGIGAALLGALADWRGIEFVYRVCAFLPLLGATAAFLPDIEKGRLRSRTAQI
ncbi:MAG: MFS transporter [Steroidobacteraceae bacterium]|nr:MFS transporter [Steroidobacteraceae bacterium]